jgi:hypothetical protein
VLVLILEAPAPERIGSYTVGVLGSTPLQDIPLSLPCLLNPTLNKGGGGLWRCLSQELLVYQLWTGTLPSTPVLH